MSGRNGGRSREAPSFVDIAKHSDELAHFDALIAGTAELRIELEPDVLAEQILEADAEIAETSKRHAQGNAELKEARSELERQLALERERTFESITKQERRNALDLALRQIKRGEACAHLNDLLDRLETSPGERQTLSKGLVDPEIVKLINPDPDVILVRRSA